MEIRESLDSWEIEIALTARCPRCNAPANERCIVPIDFVSDGTFGAERLPGQPSQIHPMRFSAAYKL